MDDGPPGKPTFEGRLRSLLAHDAVRLTRLCENLQYGALYSLTGLFLGSGIDQLLRPLYPRGEAPLRGWREFWGVVGAVILQVAVCVLAVFYTRKIVDLMPPLLNFAPGRYIPHHHVTEVTGELALALVFVATQTTLIAQAGRARDFLFPPPRR
jgi:hypothetical protein